MKAIADRILVIEDEAPEVSAGGVFIGHVADNETSRGTVLSVGSRVHDVKAGDRLLYTKYEGRELEVKGPNGETYVSIREQEATAIIEP